MSAEDRAKRNFYECGFCNYGATMLSKIATHQETDHRDNLAKVCFQNRNEYYSFQYKVKLVRHMLTGIRKLTGYMVKVEALMRSQPKHIFGCGNPSCIVFKREGKIYTPPAKIANWYPHFQRCFPQNSEFIEKYDVPFQVISTEPNEEHESTASDYDGPMGNYKKASRHTNWKDLTPYERVRKNFVLF